MVTIGHRGHGIISARCSKLKLAAQSSCEAELYALHQSTPMVLLAKQMLAEYGYDDIPTIGQDNEGTMELAHNGEGRFKRTKHIATRYFYIKELLDTNQADLEHVRTEDMPADILTKPLTGTKFINFREQLMNISSNNNNNNKSIMATMQPSGGCAVYPRSTTSTASKPSHSRTVKAPLGTQRHLKAPTDRQVV